MIGIFFLLTLLNINVIMALSWQDELSVSDSNESKYVIPNESNCTDEYCAINYTEPIIVEEEIINCDNFHWVENYIKSELEKEGVGMGKIDIVDILKNANYNLQGDLNEQVGKAKRYMYAFWTTFIFLISFLIYFFYRFDKYVKKHPNL